MIGKTVQTFCHSVWLHTSRKMSDVKIASTAEKVASMSANELVRNTVKVSDFNKRVLMFVGRFKTKEEIPERVSFAMLDKARNQARIKVCNYMIVATIIGSITMILIGKREAEEGGSVQKINMDWHRDYQEKAKMEDAAKKH